MQIKINSLHLEYRDNKPSVLLGDYTVDGTGGSFGMDGEKLEVWLQSPNQQVKDSVIRGHLVSLINKNRNAPPRPTQDRVEVIQAGQEFVV